VTPRGRGHLATTVALGLIAATGLLGLAATPASAALCSGKGVNVVVDHHGLGGGVQRGCDPGGSNQTGDRVFPDAGFALSYAQRQPGFVCRVKGAPSSDPCVNASPANAYWGLYWSDGTSGRWTYSSSGIGSLKVPEGGFLAFSWQDGGAADPPGVAPVNDRPTPTPTPTPTPAPAPGTTPTRGGGAGGAAGGAVGTGGAHVGTGDIGAAPDRSQRETSAPAARARSAAAGVRGKRPHGSATPSASPSATTSGTPSGTPTPSSEVSALSSSAQVDTVAAADEDGQLSALVPIGVLVVLGAAGGGAVLWRRRTSV
jgi:hypothetical protein